MLTACYKVVYAIADVIYMHISKVQKHNADTMISG